MWETMKQKTKCMLNNTEFKQGLKMVATMISASSAVSLTKSCRWREGQPSDCRCSVYFHPIWLTLLCLWWMMSWTTFRLTLFFFFLLNFQVLHWKFLLSHFTWLFLVFHTCVHHFTFWFDHCLWCQICPIIWSALSVDILSFGEGGGGMGGVGRVVHYIGNAVVWKIQNYQRWKAAT